MKDYKILFLDIDGTILRPDNTIEDSTKKAVSILRDKGIETVLSTGRPIHEIRETGAELNICSYIGYNGALAIYNEEEIFSESMKAETVQHILKIAAESGHEVVLYTSNQNYFTSMESREVKDFIKLFHLRQNALFTEKVLHDILGITIITGGEQEHKLYHLGEEIHLSQVNIEGMRHCFDVIRTNVNKGIGVEFLLKRLENPLESSIAFGDGMNDKEMLSTVGEGFAMGNAHEDLFQHAKHKTTAVTDSGVFNGLKKLGLLE